MALPQPNCCRVFWSSQLKQRKERVFRGIYSHQMCHCMFFPTCSWLTGMLQCIPEGQVCNRPFHARINRQTGHTGCIVHKHPFSVCQQGQHKLVLFPLTAGPGFVQRKGSTDRVPGPMLLDLTWNSFMLLRFASGLNCLLFSNHVLWCSLHGYYWPCSFFLSCLFGVLFIRQLCCALICR